MRNKHSILLIIMATVFCFAVAAAGEEAASPTAGLAGFPPGSASNTISIEVKSGSLEIIEQEGVYHISNGAMIDFGYFYIETDSFEIDMENRSARTEDNFSITMNGGLQLFGESITYDFNRDFGVLDKVKMTVKGVNFSAEQVDIVTRDRIIMKQVAATTCCIENKEYHVSAESVEFNVGGRVKFRKLALYFKGHRILKWPSYSTSLSSGMGGQEAGMDVGGWVFSPPSLGYSDYGGVEVKTDVQRIDRRLGATGLHVNYYAEEGFFPEVRQTGKIGEVFDYVVRYGKRLKENSGYFRHFGPVPVWNYPSVELTKNYGRFPGSRLEYGASFEIGEMKEEHNLNALQRAFFKGYARLPLNADRKPVRFSLLGDGRYGVYEIYKEYKIWGSGVEMEMGQVDGNYLRLQFLDFRDSGRTPFYSDLVNVNDKIFAYGAMDLGNRYQFSIDAQYDKAESNFDEIVYSASKRLECLKFSISWQSERKSVGLRMHVLNLGGLN